MDFQGKFLCHLLLVPVVLAKLEVTWESKLQYRNQPYMQNHIYPISCSNASLLDISCRTLRRYCSEKTIGNSSHVGRTKKILHRGKGIRDVKFQDNFLCHLSLATVELLPLVVTWESNLPHRNQPYMPNHMY